MFIAIMATVMPMLERLGESKIETCEAYVWTRSLLTIFKGQLMMTVFIVNGLANDFFIGTSFFITTIIGFIYFKINPYHDPSILDKK